MHHHQKTPKESTFLEMDPGSPYIPHRFPRSSCFSSMEATSRCTAWALQGIKRTTVWAPRNVAWQSTVSMLSDEHVKWQMPWEAPIGARCRRDLVGEISRWKERRKGTQKVGVCYVVDLFSLFLLVCRCCYLICWELFPSIVAKQSQVQDDMFPFLEGSDLASKQKRKFFSSWKRECNLWRFPSERDMVKKGTLQCPELLYGDPGW